MSSPTGLSELPLDPVLHAVSDDVIWQHVQVHHHQSLIVTTTTTCTMQGLQTSELSDMESHSSPNQKHKKYDELNNNGPSLFDTHEVKIKT